MKKNTVDIKEFLSAIGFALGEGYEYGWDCYGDSAFGIDWTSSDLKASAVMVYDSKDGRVFEVSVWDDDAPFVLRWTRRGYASRRKKESLSRGFDDARAIDKVRFRDVGRDKIIEALKKLVRRKRNGC
jgi:hypothetical protein